MPDADPFDRATAQEMEMLQHQLQAQAAKASKSPRLQAAGYCQNPRCGEEFVAGDQRLFCNSQCAAEHQRLTRT